MHHGKLFFNFNFEFQNDYCISAVITRNVEKCSLLFNGNGKLECISKMFFEQFIVNNINEKLNNQEKY